MCGIAGIVSVPIRPSHAEVVQRMTDAIAHRGPDGQGHLAFANCILGHRRLAIVDLQSGAQPMRSAVSEVAVTFNGEIYGYQALRREQTDYSFRTQSDTELLLALYQRYGTRMLDHLPGMFAFALWDDRKRELFCARDRFGEKPFYYAIGRGGEFIFASEIKGIIASGLVDPVLDRAAVARYLRRQCTRTDQSIYSNIKALAPAHYLVYRDGRVHVSRYWLPPATENDIDAGEAVERCRTLLDQAVQRQLVADVPVGAFLSGGLDSSTICLMASRHVEQLRTFAFDFQGDHSEMPYARAVASAYRTKHVELTVPGVDIAQELVRMQSVCDEPFGDSSTIPSYLLAREARQHVKVALTGDAGDELFGGYLWYKPLLWMQREGRIGMLRWIAERVVNRACGAAGIPGAAARELRIVGLAHGRQYASILEAHRAQLSFFNSEALRLLGLADVAPEPDGFGPAGAMDDAIRFDVEDYMPANNLLRTDRASMANGLELRAPFLDVEFASFCMSLPYRLKVSTRADKIILRQAFSQQWPVEIRKRSKQGFGAPLARWLQEPGIQDLECRCVSDPHAPLYQVLAERGVRQVLAAGDPIQRWTLLVLGLWLTKAQAASKADSASIDTSALVA
jgi:asparagine synthase (glutamine-hydrolysing)